MTQLRFCPCRYDFTGPTIMGRNMLAGQWRWRAARVLHGGGFRYYSKVQGNDAVRTHTE